MSPKAFISYSWSSPAHEAWVLRLATELRESGVDVTFDKWDLREGHDAYAFMEQMVTDPAMEKVIMVCDSSYATKANGRNGGVGTEAQIITPEIYGKQKQDKFVAVLSEKDDQGEAYLPVFYRSRVYIDLSSAEVYSNGFEQLLRWIFGKPLHVRPELGKVPGFLTSTNEQPKLATAAMFRRAVEMLRSGQVHAGAAATEYFGALCAGLENFRIKCTDADRNTFDDIVVKSIEDFLPYRDECVTLFTMLVVYADDATIVDVLHKFFENLIPYMDRPEDVMQFYKWDFDNFRFIVHELFLYAVATLVKNGKFSAAAGLLESEYYVTDHDGRSVMMSFRVLIHEMRSLDHRNQRLSLRKYCIRADLLKERCKGLAIEFRDLMQADFVLFLRAKFSGEWWHPFTAVLMGFVGSPFEIFVRAKSRRYFDRIAPMLGVAGKEALQSEMKKLTANPQNLPRGVLHALPVAEATGVDGIATKP